jgi:hypothetical protein
MDSLSTWLYFLKNKSKARPKFLPWKGRPRDANWKEQHQICDLATLRSEKPLKHVKLGHPTVFNLQHTKVTMLQRKLRQDGDCLLNGMPFSE